MLIELPAVAANIALCRAKLYKAAFFHFSNNNLSVRRSCIRDIGGYDPRCRKSEDVDVSIRIARSPSWVALRERGCVVGHRPRETVSDFLRQMWGWGAYLGYPYSKTNMKGIYLYWVNSRRHVFTRKLEIQRFPFMVCLFLSDFHVAHAFLALALIAGLCGYPPLAAVCAAFAAVFLYRYSHDDRSLGLPPLKTLQIALLHYMANAAFITATVLGSLRRKILLVPSSIFRTGARKMSCGGLEAKH